MTAGDLIEKFFIGVHRWFKFSLRNFSPIFANGGAATAEFWINMVVHNETSGKHISRRRPVWIFLPCVDDRVQIGGGIGVGGFPDDDNQ